MCLQVPDDLTPLLFNVLACILANQREMVKLLDTSCDKTKDLLAMTDSAFSVLLPILTKLQETSSTRRDVDPISPVPADVKFETSSHHSVKQNFSRVDVNGSAKASARNDTPKQLKAAELHTSEKTVKAVKTEARFSGIENTRLGCGFLGDFQRNVAASKKEQERRRNVLLIRGVLDEAVPTSDELELARSLLSPCANIASVVKAYRMGTQQNILGVELDRPSARAVVDFFWANRQAFPSLTMSVAPSRAPSLQYAVRQLHNLQKLLAHHLPQLNPRIVKGTGLLLRDRDHFTAFAAVAPGLVLSNGDAISLSLFREKSDHPVTFQKNGCTSNYYQADDRFVEID
jgi:hypothetical protein